MFFQKEIKNRTCVTGLDIQMIRYESWNVVPKPNMIKFELFDSVCDRSRKLLNTNTLDWFELRFDYVLPKTQSDEHS